MNIKNLTLAIFIFSFLGCSTSNNVATVSNLQVKVAQIENRMNKKDQELEKLRYEVREIAQIVDSFDAIGDGDISDDFDDIKIEDPIVKKSVSRSRVASKKEGTIRVSVKISVIQEALFKAGYYDGAIDGKLGDKTRKAILGFQKDHGLVADGILGKKTWSEMKVYLDQ